MGGAIALVHVPCIPFNPPDPVRSREHRSIISPCASSTPLPILLWLPGDLKARCFTDIITERAPSFLSECA